MTPLSIFGLVAVTLMLICDALEEKHHAFSLVFAAACVMGSAYGFLQGAWPFGVVEGIWAVMKVYQWATRDN